tara:strand:- start:14233 stop:15582 length:1350 start_codon:yes stop_codon:yes gene_type:complete
MKRDIKMFWPAVPKKEDLLPGIEKLLWPEDGGRPFIGEGPLVQSFENACMEKWGMDYVLFTNSGTSALDLALLGAGVKANDEVITTALTCTATNLPILRQQATPVFADVQYKTGNICPKSIREKITDKTKALMFVHWGGLPCDMDEINDIASEYDLSVIADGAHALGATYHGKPISDFADYTMFSLQSIKQLTTIDGGLLNILFKNSTEEQIKLIQNPKNAKMLRGVFGGVLNSYFNENPLATEIPEDYFLSKVSDILPENFIGEKDSFRKFWIDWQKAESCRRRRWFGIGREERAPAPGKGYFAYPTFEVGEKFHAHNLSALVGLNSMKQIDKWQARRNEVAKIYNEELKDVSGVELFQQYSDRTSGNWLYNLHVDDRGSFVDTMANRGVECSIVHERNDFLPIFRKYSVGDYPGLEKINKDRVCIPMHQNLSDKDVEYAIDSIKLGW